MDWATKKNLTLNCIETKEMIFCAKTNRSGSAGHDLPPPLQNIERVKNLTVLGVVINDRLTAVDQHVRGYCRPIRTTSRYAVTAWRRHLCTTCSGRSWSADFCTVPWRGLDSVQPQTARSSKRFCGDVDGLATASMTLLLLPKCLKKLTINCSAVF